MTVLELLNKVSRNDLCIRLTEFYPSIFNTIEKAKKYTDIFFKDNEELILDEISEEDKDFVVVVNKLNDEPDDYSLFEEGTPIDTSKLTMSYYVDGIHLNHLKKHKDELCYTLDEVREKNLFPIYTYGLDFLPKTTTLAYPICQVSLDEYDELDVAAAIFYEVTFYGLENNDIIDRGKELDQRVDSLNKENFENTKKISI